MRLQCKVEPGSGVDRIVLKMAPTASAQVEMIKEMFPRFNVIFNTRHPRPSLNSILKVLYAVNRSFFARSGIMWHYLAYLLTRPYKEEYRPILDGLNKWVKPMSYKEAMAYIYASSFACFLEAKHIYRHVVLYEDLVENPEAEVGRLFEAMGVPHDMWSEAMGALQTDSQNRKFGDRGETVRLGARNWRRVEEILSLFRTGLTRDMAMEDFRRLLELSRR